MWFSKEIIKEMYKENLLLVSNCKKKTNRNLLCIKEIAMNEK